MNKRNEMIGEMVEKTANCRRQTAFLRNSGHVGPTRGPLRILAGLTLIVLCGLRLGQGPASMPAEISMEQTVTARVTQTHNADFIDDIIDIIDVILGGGGGDDDKP